ncbi:hypothetical protein [Thermus thermophilus]|uniref:hypothetical protein n=1 Tax=Thermus thermophilus TaxID=274 RepID=UPI001D042D71|nr:hypothetical protein [Thermus thermophilus]WMV94470.1 hypothetical protein RB649_05165 [Thermus thermophilus HB27]
MLALRGRRTSTRMLHTRRAVQKRTSHQARVKGRSLNALSKKPSEARKAPKVLVISRRRFLGGQSILRDCRVIPTQAYHNWGIKKNVASELATSL